MPSRWQRRGARLLAPLAAGWAALRGLGNGGADAGVSDAAAAALLPGGAGSRSTTPEAAPAAGEAAAGAQQLEITPAEGPEGSSTPAARRPPPPSLPGPPSALCSRPLSGAQRSPASSPATSPPNHAALPDSTEGSETDSGVE